MLPVSNDSCFYFRLSAYQTCHNGLAALTSRAVHDVSAGNDGDGGDRHKHGMVLVWDKDVECLLYLLAA